MDFERNAAPKNDLNLLIIRNSELNKKEKIERIGILRNSLTEEATQLHTTNNPSQTSIFQISNLDVGPPKLKILEKNSWMKKIEKLKTKI